MSAQEAGVVAFYQDGSSVLERGQHVCKVEVDHAVNLHEELLVGHKN